MPKHDVMSIVVLYFISIYFVDKPVKVFVMENMFYFSVFLLHFEKKYKKVCINGQIMRLYGWTIVTQCEKLWEVNLLKTYAGLMTSKIVLATALKYINSWSNKWTLIKWERKHYDTAAAFISSFSDSIQSNLFFQMTSHYFS